MNIHLMEEEIFAEEALFNKYQNMKSSGYLDNMYELSRDFRQVTDNHLIKQSDVEFIQLQLLLKNSVPLHTGLTPSTRTSDAFNKKINDILGSLDSLNPLTGYKKKKDILSETDGNYSENRYLEGIYENVRLHSLNNGMENLSLKKDEAKSKQKNRNKCKIVKNSIEVQNEQQAKKQLINKIKKMTFQDYEL